jgi:hypothetical protein
MPRCPNCFFELNLHPHRRKYKCAKCGRWFLQSEIDTKEFVEFNKRERKAEKDEAIKQRNKEYIERTKESRKQWFKGYYQKNKEKYREKAKEYYHKNKEKINQKAREKQAKYREENREEYNQQKRAYWANHREHLLVKRKENYERQKPRIQAQQKLYRQNNKLLKSINSLRTRQKELALRLLKNGQIKPFTFEFENTLPTFELSELLPLWKSL